jgi:hypothetical protein
LDVILATGNHIQRIVLCAGLDFLFPGKATEALEDLWFARTVNRVVVGFVRFACNFLEQSRQTPVKCPVCKREISFGQVEAQFECPHCGSVLKSSHKRWYLFLVIIDLIVIGVLDHITQSLVVSLIIGIAFAILTTLLVYKFVPFRE